MLTEDVRKAVYGELYEEAVKEMTKLNNSINIMRGRGFASAEDCATWAKAHLLDMVVLGRAQHQFFYVSHRGDIINKDSWTQYYGMDVLYYQKGNKLVAWIPTGFHYYDAARVNGEREDNGRKPLYHRDYFTPTGYYDPLKGTFNSAKPFPFVAKETGRDTSFIYEYIKHVTGECYMWMLAWLRAKMLYPNEKTQVVPVIVSREQGSGKSTIGEVICKGLFGKDNVLVSEQYDSQARFNADAVDALVICIEEKDENEKRNSTSALKSRTTATQVRKEHKGIDPYYQDSFTEHIITTNRDVPIKFEGRENQRRFMVMEADPTFTRDTSALADEIFTKLYGEDGNKHKVGIPFTEDGELVSQFKHELATREDIASVQLRNFPHTSAYERCFTLPRTSESTEVETILRSLAPYIKASLLAEELVTLIDNVSISQMVQTVSALQYVPSVGGIPAYVAICRPIVFYDPQTTKPYGHAVTERALYDCEVWLREMGLHLIPNMSPLPGGFMGIQGRYRSATAARISLLDTTPIVKTMVTIPETIVTTTPERIGKRVRFNSRMRPDDNGEFETVNELKPNTERKLTNVAYMDTFLLESDETSNAIYQLEEDRLNRAKTKGVIEAGELFNERLAAQLSEAKRLFDEGKVARVVYSGAKSHHCLIRIKDSPMDAEEYSWLHGYLVTMLSDKVVYDHATNDCTRLTRAPIERLRYSTRGGVQIIGTQKLVLENWNNVWDLDWRPAYDKFQSTLLISYGKTVHYPVKQEYYDAMEALINGTFWTDSKWNGNRQRCFFPAYRVCRSMGYSHYDLWSDDMILRNLYAYYKPMEIQYWRTRETCDLVKRIDEEIDDMKEDK